MKRENDRLSTVEYYIIRAVGILILLIAALKLLSAELGSMHWPF